MRSLLTLMLVASVGAAPAAFRALEGRLLVDGVEGGVMEPGQPSRWTAGFRDTSSGEPVTQFDMNHEKAMHLIVVPADLSTFAHVHPGHDAGSGAFVLDANHPTDDPDNQDVARAVTRSGPHFLFAEVKPAGQAVQLHRFTVTAAGDAAPEAVEPDPLQDGVILTEFEAGYRVSLRPEAMKHKMLHLGFHVERRGADGSYAPVEDLEPWLGMQAHAVLIGAAGTTAADRVFRHLHAGHHGDHGKDGGATPPAAGPSFMFMLHGDDVPPHGVYKVWLQVKHQGRVLRFPFTFAI